MQGNNFGLRFTFFVFGWIMIMAVPQQFHAVLCWQVLSLMHVLSGQGVLAGCGNNLLFSAALFESVRLSMDVYVLCMCGMCFWIDVLFVVF